MKINDIRYISFTEKKSGKKKVTIDDKMCVAFLAHNDLLNISFCNISIPINKDKYIKRKSMNSYIKNISY
tara:strand:- start:1598 stop:1807 length:210 start_codon:yes stop_codon:yes gene_type:complete